MKVEPLNQRTTDPAAGKPASAGSGLTVGSVLAAEAIRDALTGQTLLLLAGRRWAIKPGGAADAVPPGSRVAVRVTRLQPEVELTLVGKRDDVGAALRRQMPMQASPLRLVANLAWLAAGDSDLRAELPTSVNRAVQELWNALPDAARLADPAGLEQACRSSGVQMEGRLASERPAELAAQLGTDLKALLYRLKDAVVRSGPRRIGGMIESGSAPLPARHATLTALPPETATLPAAADTATILGELAQQTQESIARITCNQLAGLGQGGQVDVPLLVELPFRDGDRGNLLRLRFEREAPPSESAAPPRWSVDFALDLGEFGPLRGSVSLVNGRVDVALRPERSTLAQQLDAREDELAQSLQDAGLKVGRLRCIRSDSTDTSSTGSWLINLRA